MKYCTINPRFYEEHPNLIKILDINEMDKHNYRIHLCLDIQVGRNHVLIPLRKNLGKADRPFGRIGYPVPSKSKPNAGLDYRYMMVLRDEKYINYETPKLPRHQLNMMEQNYKIIEKEAIAYLNGYIKKAKKGRSERTPLYRESSLVNFHQELEIEMSK